MNKSELRKADEWSGEHRGVYFHIRCHYRDWTSFDDNRMGLDKRPCWCAYLILDERMIPEAKRADFLAPRYPAEKMHGNPSYYEYSGTALDNLDWHGGCTYYRIHGSDLPGWRRIEAGCDYSHGFDDGHIYSVESVERDIRATIDDLHARHPDLLVRDWYDGSYWPREMMTEDHRGFLSPQGKAKMAEWDAKEAARKENA